MSAIRQDLTRTTLVVICILLLIAGSLWVLRPFLAATRWVFDQAGSLGGTMVQFLLVVILSVVMYSSGESAASGVRRFGRRLAGQRGEDSVILAGKAIRSVALGVGVTAVVQTVLGAIGLAVAGARACCEAG